MTTAKLHTDNPEILQFIDGKLQLLTEFERFAYDRSKHTAFTELLDWTLLPLRSLTHKKNNSKPSRLIKLTPK